MIAKKMTGFHIMRTQTANVLEIPGSLKLNMFNAGKTLTIFQYFTKSAMLSNKFLLCYSQKT